MSNTNHEEAGFVADDCSTHKAASDSKPSPEPRRVARMSISFVLWLLPEKELDLTNNDNNKD